jgi:hypothetical protein
MKIIYTFFLFTSISLSTLAQGLDFSWAKSAGDTSVDYGTSITSDVNGNVLAAGYFDSPSIKFGNITLTNSQQNSLYIVKLNAVGVVVWAKNIGIDSSYISDITTDKSGNIFIIGSFAAKTIILGLDTLSNSGTNSIYIAKCDSNGNVLWARSAGNDSYCEGKRITTNANGEILIAGNYFSSSLTIESTTLPNSGEWDFFMAKYNTNGDLLWANHVGEEKSELINSISTDQNGNILIAGSFSSSNITIGTSQLTNASNDDDVLLAKYDANGSAIWAKSAGGEVLDKVVDICADSTGNIFITGTYHSPFIIFGNTVLTKVAYSDMFVVKYDVSGNVLWANNIGGSYYEYACCIAIDSNENLIIIGGFNSPTLSIGSKTLTSAGYDDIFIVKYNSAGNNITAYNIGGTNHDQAYSSAIDAAGNIFMTGMYYSTNLVIGNDTLINAGYSDVFIAKLGDSFTSGISPYKNSNIKIYPNPTNNIIFIKGLAPEEKTEITICDIQGKIILMKEILENGTIDLSDFTQGVYVIKMGNVVQRIVKM